jgi:RNA polymerase sigma-70 factor (ECF subfamily)
MMDFNTLYRKYAPDVHRFALYLSGNRAEAEDITAETFVRVWASPGRIEIATVKGYLFTIARNLFLQGLRKGSTHVGLAEGLEHQVPDPRAGPQAQVEQKEEFQAVMQGLQRLPELDRAALLMRALDGMPYEEIARALGITLSAVKVKIHRARLVLAGVRDT